MQRIGGGHDVGDRLVDRPRRFFTFALAGSLLILLACAVALVALPPAERETLGDRASVPFAAIATIACALRSLRVTSRARVAWALLAAACLSWTVGEILWAVWSRQVDTPPISWLDDAFYLLGVPLAIAALAVIPGSQWRGSDRFGNILDGLILGSATLFVFRGLGLLARGEGPLLDQVLTISYPVGDLVMLTMAMTLLLRAPRSTSTHLVLLAGAQASYVIGDSIYAIQVGRDEYHPGTLLDLTWLASYALVALAAASPTSALPLTGSPPAPYLKRITPWPLLGTAILAAAAVAIFGPVRVTEDPLMIGTGFLVALLFAARQGWLAWDIARLNRALTQQVQRTDEISEAVIDGVLVADKGGLISSSNEPAAQLLGRPCVVGLSLFDLLGTTPIGDAASDTEVVAAIRQGQRLVGVETAFRLDGGAELPVEVTIGPLHKRGRLAGTVVVFRDISARQAVDRMKQEFLSVVSHELRTPLASIRGALALLDNGVDGSLGPHSARMINIALVSSERLSRLLDDILDIERLARGRVHLLVATHRAEDLVAVAANEMGAFATQQEVKLRVGHTPGEVTADRDRVVQVLTNLIHNAIKFSAGDADVVVSTRIVDSAVEFCVADHGRGIPVDKLESIFEPFEQVDSSDSRQINGTGLGLAICRDLVRLHGGHIWATTTLGVGSEFRFTLPVAIATPAAILDADDPVPTSIAG